MELLCFFLFGCLIGSFLNVCIVRLPAEKSVVFPSSHCPKCQKNIEWYDNIPLISWMILGGKCRHCQSPISFRYWMVEFLTGSTFAAFYLHYGLNPLLTPYLVMVACFIVAMFVDLEHRIIPDEVSVGGMWAGIFLSALIPQMHPMTDDLVSGSFFAGFIVVICLFLTWIYPIFCKHLIENEEPYDDKPLKVLVLVSLIFIALITTHTLVLPGILNAHAHSLAGALIGFIIGGGSIYMMGLIGDIIFRKESMGGGDVKLMAMVGAFLGWKIAILAFFIAPFFGGVIGIIEKIRTKDSTIAYGPFLVLGTLISLFWGQAIVDWLLNGGIYHL
ncbi:MAG: prepilin peptidase [Candidatus Omnitrophica bacterium]|nr:prepilin peptidase [Candidatus Omnitrophota bacterium]